MIIYICANDCIFMSKGRSTIHDIAKELNITASTVSRALNDHPRISEATKKAVQEVAHKLNYQTNSIAAALRSGRSHIMGVIVPTANRSFFASVVRGIEQVAYENGYNVLICQSNDSYEVEVRLVDTLLSMQVDGIIASIGRGTRDFQHFKKVRQRGVSLVLFDRVNEEMMASTVVIDDYLGAFRATEHLIEQGCRRIAHFSGQEHINIYKYRLRGYQEALLAHGLPFDPDLVFWDTIQLETGRAAAEQILQMDPRPDAIFAASDYAAMGAMQVLKANKIAIPGEVALVGFMNEPFTSFVEPALTSVDQVSEEMGRFAAKVFLEEVSAENFIPRKTVITPQLVVRSSSLRPVTA